MKKLILIPFLALSAFAGDPSATPPKPNKAVPQSAPVTRAEFLALTRRVAVLENQIRFGAKPAAPKPATSPKPRQPAPAK